MDRILRKYAASLGLDSGYSAHSMRATFITTALNNGASLERGEDKAPDPNGVYKLVARKHAGVNLGLTVKDKEGREWSVKQPFPGGLDPEGPVEVALSRLLWGGAAPDWALPISPSLPSGAAIVGPPGGGDVSFVVTPLLYC